MIGGVAGSTVADPQICVDGPDVYVVWQDGRNQAQKIYVNRSLNSGASWLGQTWINPGGTGTASEPRIGATVGWVSVVCIERRANPNVGDVYFNFSPDLGATWQPDDVRIDTQSPGGSADSRTPRLAVTWNNVYVTWAEQVGAWKIHYNSSQVAGQTWLPNGAVQLDSSSPSHSLSKDPTSVTSGWEVFVAWVDERNSSTRDIYFRRSLDGGTTWPHSETRLDTGVPAGHSRSEDPQLAFSDSSVYAVWNDQRTYYGRPDSNLNFQAVVIQLTPYIGTQASNGVATWVG